MKYFLAPILKFIIVRNNPDPGVKGKSNFMKALATMSLVMMMHSATGQFLLDKFPLDRTMVPRNLLTNQGNVHFYFTSVDTVLAPNVFLKKYTDSIYAGNLYPSYVLTGGQYIYTYNDPIIASLHANRYELWYGNNMISAASNICCGDFYILNGQSNAESRPGQDSCYPYYNNFIRSYGNANEMGSKKEWFVASGDGTRNTDGHIGQLGIAIAHELLTKQMIPICVLNGAVGGQQLQYFLADTNNHENPLTGYGRLLTRVKEAGVTDAIRAIIWYQGEADAGLCNAYYDYTNKFHTLYQAWKTDYPDFEHLYLFQIRPGCGQNRYCTNVIQEVHKQISSTDSNVEVMSTSNFDHANDQCHYNYQNGYKLLGKKVSRLICANQYQSFDTIGIHSPRIKNCYTRYANYVDIVPDQPTTVDTLAAHDFYLTQSKVEPLSIHILNDTIRLVFADPVLPGETISYSGHYGAAPPYLENQQGNGLLCFCNQEILPYCEIPLTTFTQTACNSFVLNGQLYTSSGTYAQVYSGTYGCDSVISLDLTIHYSNGITINQTACDSFSLNGQTYLNSGVYTQYFNNALGCDSIVTLNLLINHTTYSILNHTACDSYTLNGETFTHNGTYIQQFINATGCDSILTLNLVVGQSTAFSMIDTACGSYTLNGQTYTSSGNYTQVIGNAAGCDSVIFLNLTVKPPANTLVTQNGPILHANATLASYQWLSCYPYQVIPGQVNPDFMSIGNGSFAVVVTESGCTDTSACFTVSGLGFQDQSYIGILIYPNSNSGTFTLDIGSSENALMRIYNVLGDLVFESEITQSKSIINLSVAKGVYFYKVKNERGLLGSGRLLIE